MRFLVSCVLLALACAHIATADQTYSLTLPVVTKTAGAAVLLNPTAVQVGGTFTFSFETNATNSEVSLCFQRNFEPITGKCMLSITTTYENKVGAIVPAPGALLPGTYYVTATTNSTEPISFSANITVNACAVDQMFDTGLATCVDAPRLGPGASQKPALVAGANLLRASVSFAYTAEPAVNGFQFEGVALNEVVIKGAYGANHIETALSVNQTFVASAHVVTPGSTTYFFPLPSNIQGMWYFELAVKANGTGSANWTLEQPNPCTSENRKGCATTVSTLGKSVISFKIGNGKLGYVAYPGQDNSWRIGVSTVQGPTFNSRLSVYVGLGYLPYVASSGLVIADYSAGCSLPASQCSQVTTIDLPKASTTNTPYFIAVAYRNGTNSADTLVWASSAKTPCPYCVHGSCPAPSDAATYGKCKCNYGYAGTDCSLVVPNFRIQIIVVIIIGVLLLVTAIIGLIAWFISKRRASQTTGYERV